MRTMLRSAAAISAGARARPARARRPRRPLAPGGGELRPECSPERGGSRRFPADDHRRDEVGSRASAGSGGVTRARPSFASRRSTGASVASLAIAALYSSLMSRRSWPWLRPGRRFVRLSYRPGVVAGHVLHRPEPPRALMFGLRGESMSIAKPKLWSDRRWGAFRLARSTALKVLRPSTVLIAAVISARSGSGVAASLRLIIVLAWTNAALSSGCTLVFWVTFRNVAAPACRSRRWPWPAPCVSRRRARRIR